jgi:hypothetical protein
MGSHNVHMSSTSWVVTSVKIYVFKKLSYYAKLDQATQTNYRLKRVHTIRQTMCVKE